MKNKIWLITGISSGLGQAIAQTALENGDWVIGTFRNQSQVDDFNVQYKNQALALLLDVTQPDQIAQVAAVVQEKFGRLDVLVNNAGFGFAGAIEETTIAEARAVFEANFFGTLSLTQAILPLMRQQKSGHIIQISSHGGFKAFPGFGIYNASKFALEGFSEALAAEVAPLGIKLTLVEPGPFRTKFADSSFGQAQTIIKDYLPTAGAFKERMKQVNGKQEGDPIKAAQAIFELSRTETPPLRLPLGSIAVASLTDKLESVQKNLNEYRALAQSVVYKN